jgi:hypothetical protein
LSSVDVEEEKGLIINIGTRRRSFIEASPAPLSSSALPDAGGRNTLALWTGWTFAVSVRSGFRNFQFGPVFSRLVVEMVVGDVGHQVDVVVESLSAFATLNACKVACFVKKNVKNIFNVERIDLSPLSREYARLNVMAADLGSRHKSDDFNSFLMHLFF